MKRAAVGVGRLDALAGGMGRGRRKTVTFGAAVGLQLDEDGNRKNQDGNVEGGLDCAVHERQGFDVESCFFAPDPRIE